MFTSTFMNKDRHCKYDFKKNENTIVIQLLFLFRIINQTKINIF